MSPEAPPTAPSLERVQAQARTLADRVISGDRAALSEALNQVDDSRVEHKERGLCLLDALAPHSKGLRIGVTGAPGAGKSTLLDALVSALREQDRSVGVLAVDPSSQRTGGALLGDRMRLGSSARDAGVFLRSLAARDQLGGLSAVTGPSLDVLSSAVDCVFVETVGVGQSESQVIDLVDTLVFVAQPAAGDLLQFMKAGILEWPDIFFVNKADLGDIATRSAAELRAGLDLSQQRDPDHLPPVLCGSARDGLGLEALIEAIDQHARHLSHTNLGETRRRVGRLARVQRALTARYGAYGLDRLARSHALEERVVKRASVSVDRVIDELSRVIEKDLRSGNGS